ncbi:uncharacterized protein LTR77_004236 [Saxophila tyrrhenica]|uniref:Uncharacterized protein n=1 Tax=Saxophila tyrrhenica TaxID=1690608 RepID=A0AAV9PC79_9PEZI|nr:hypothetical protein LTR77_004236 [Saxophila tyrrhenica]
MERCHDRLHGTVPLLQQRDEAERPAHSRPRYPARQLVTMRVDHKDHEGCKTFTPLANFPPTDQGHHAATLAHAFCIDS